MSDPAIISCPADQWTKVATSVKIGTIHKTLNTPNVYLQTFRDTGGAAPTDKSDAVKIFDCSSQSSISSSVNIDVYVYAVGSAGEVRVDL